jgi:hypothetical protein
MKNLKEITTVILILLSISSFAQITHTLTKYETTDEVIQSKVTNGRLTSYEHIKMDCRGQLRGLRHIIWFQSEDDSEKWNKSVFKLSRRYRDNSNGEHLVERMQSKDFPGLMFVLTTNLNGFSAKLLIYRLNDPSIYTELHYDMGKYEVENWRQLQY